MLQRTYIPSLQVFTILLLQLIFSVRGEAQGITPQSIVARFESRYTISFAELQKYVSDQYYDLLYRNNKVEGYKKGLEEMVVNKLKVIDFFNLQLYENKKLIQSIMRTINEELVIEYYKTRFLGKYVNEKSIEEAYEDMGREVVYRRILFVEPENASQLAIDSLKAMAVDLRTQLQAGADFAGLAKKYSGDTASFHSVDSLHLINWKMSITNPFDRIVFNLGVGKVRILEVNRSIQLVKVVDIRKISTPPLEEVKDDIVRTLDERYMDYCLQEFDSTKNKLVDENTLEWNQEGLDQLVEWSNIPGFYKNTYKDTLQYAISHGRNFRILKYSKGTVDLREYLRLLDNVLILGGSSSIGEKDIKEFILEAVRTNIIVRKANELNLEKDIFSPATTNPVLQNEIVWLYDQQMIETQIPQATAKQLRQFYDDNKDSLFYQLPIVSVYAIIDSNKTTLDELKRKLDQNVPFEKLTGEVLVKTFIKNRDGIIKSHLSIEKPFLGEAAFKLELYEIAGPIEYVDPEKGKQFALIKCVERREEKQLLYQDVEKTIADDFTKYYREKITRATQEQLEKKYTVKIYKDVILQNLSSMGINAQW